ncbi:hypothetical protein LB553_01270 [Mesorhizobium sp. CA8]|uniref:hypothetical protein n=1 Tax=Mesorhizobium sp. CA8 TaxID=2876637 RepID=UPI001CCF77ED|nr:hypothetical protein [Mesorhizobium sp. CA8]MBZ9759517.1 hypothetical protein [Mesorhizobium sp. CA8]
MKLLELPTIGKTGKRHGEEPVSEIGHFMVCPVCGQAFDRRDLGQVLYHAEPLHEPLEIDA